MKTVSNAARTLVKLPFALTFALSLTLPAYGLAQGDDAATATGATSFTEMFTKGRISGNARIIYFSTRNSYFSDFDQDTASYGGNLIFKTAKLAGFSAGVSGFIQRPIAHSHDMTEVDNYLHPNLLGLGMAYGQWENEHFRITAGNQLLEVPFASSSDWRMVPPMYQGISARYSDDKNFLTGFGMHRYKSYIDNSFTKRTTYNEKIDAFSTIGSEETDGFWGVGGGRTDSVGPVDLKGQAWYVTYLDYARMSYLEGQIMQKEGAIKPFAGFQFFYEEDDGKALLGKVQSEVYGLQLGAKRNSLTATLGYNYITPHSDSYLNGALVTPYAHNVSSGPLFAQPYLSSTQDLGAGSAYAFDISGAPCNNLFVGARYSFMDLKDGKPDAPRSINQSEYLVYGIYNFTGKLKRFSIADFLAVQTSPRYDQTFVQNRLTLEYAF